MVWCRSLHVYSEGFYALKTLSHGLKGSGLSKYNGSEQSIQSIAADAREVLSSLKVNTEDVVVVGHSMGGMVASHLTSSYRFKGVVLIGPVHPNPNAATVFGKRIETVQQCK